MLQASACNTELLGESLLVVRRTERDMRYYIIILYYIRYDSNKVYRSSCKVLVIIVRL